MSSIQELQALFKAFKEETDHKLKQLESENNLLKTSLDTLLSTTGHGKAGTLPRPASAPRKHFPNFPKAPATTDNITKRPATAAAAVRRKSVDGRIKSSSSSDSIGEHKWGDAVSPRAAELAAKSKAPVGIAKRQKAMAEHKVEIDEKRIGSCQVGKRKVFYVVPADYVKSAAEDTPSDKDLKLEYVFGYNGKETQNNLFYVNKERGAAQLVYCIAATGVNYDVSSDAQKFFIGHNEDILCLAVHPTKPLAATGQLDSKGSGKPFVCIWDYNSMQLVTKIENFHERGVCAVAFSKDGKYLISVGNDDSHTAGVFDWENDTKKPIAEGMVAKDEVYGIAVNHFNDKLEFVAYGSKLLKHFVLVPSENKTSKYSQQVKGVILSSFKSTKVVQSAFHSAVYLKTGDLVVGTHTGAVYTFKNNVFSKAISDAHKEKCKVGALVLTSDGFASAADDGVLKVWKDDLSPVGAIELGKYKVRSLDFAAVGRGKFVVGTSSNTILEVNMEGKAPRVIMEGHSNELWGLGVHPTKPLFVTCGNDKTVRAWDCNVRKPVPGKVLVLKDEAICCNFSPDGATIAVGTNNGKIILVDYASFAVTYEKKHRQELISAVAFSPGGQLLALASWDQMAELIDMTSPAKNSVTLKGHTSSITHLTFSDDNKYLITNSKDYEILFWSTETGKRVDKSITADTKWADWSCILGFPVKGIFSKDQDGTDNNAAHVSYAADPTARMVVTGNDTGEVSLFRYPASYGAVKKYVGHSSHVTNVRFTRDNQHVVSCGGNDTGVFLWRIA